MDNQLLTGKLVRLTAQDPATDPEAIERWDHDSEYTRLLSIEPVRPTSAREAREWMEKPRGESAFRFSIHTLQDDRIIGFLNVMRVDYINGNCFVGIGIGEREFWSKGYGTDAMKLALRFAFTELNMQRVSLDLLASNARAQRSYEKCGFRVEGVERRSEGRDGSRQDILAMGILVDEWQDDAQISLPSQG